MKIHEPRNYSTEYITTKNLLSTWGETRKKNKKIHVSLHICIFIHAMRNNWWKYNCTTVRRLITCMQKQKFKKNLGELITHHPFLDDVGCTILSHHHQWCSSSCFPTWEVQILKHIVQLNKKLFWLADQDSGTSKQQQPITARYRAICLWHNNIENGLLMHDDSGTVHENMLWFLSL